MAPGRKPSETKEMLNESLANITEKVGGFPNVKLQDIPNFKIDRSTILKKLS